MNADPGASGGSVPRLSDDQLRELMRLIKGSNSVELKISVPASAHRATIQGLPMDPVEAQPRQIYFFDTPDLQLYRAGVVVRARRIAGGRGDTVVKLRPVEPEQIPSDLKNDPSFNIEVDALPGGFVCSASFKGRTTGALIRDAITKKKKLSKIFSKPQRAFYRLHAPKGIDLDSLVPLGPTFILKSRFDGHMGLDGMTTRSMVAEMWLYPDGARILELSTKCLPIEALAVAAEARAYLIEKRVSINAAQETKTRTALEFYSKALMAELAVEQAEGRRTARGAEAAKAAAKPAAKVASKPKSAAKAAAKTKAPAKTAVAKPAAKSKAPAKVAPAAAKSVPAKPAAQKPAAAKPAAAKPAAAKSAPAKPAAQKPAASKPAAKPAAARSTAGTARRPTTRRTTTRRAPTRSTTRRTPPKQP